MDKVELIDNERERERERTSLNVWFFFPPFVG